MIKLMIMNKRFVMWLRDKGRFWALILVLRLSL